MDQLISALDRKAKDLASRGLRKSPLRGSKIVVHGTKNQLRRRLPPLENCRSGCVLHDLFRLPATPPKLQHIQVDWTHAAQPNVFGFIRCAGGSAAWPLVPARDR